MFNAQSLCDSVHSQSRRMVVVSPEPNFWMHAVGCHLRMSLIASEDPWLSQCIELAKIPRPVKANAKGKGKQQETVYDYNESSLHDDALRTRLLLAYEAFKVIY